MALVSATCDDCGDIELRSRDLVVDIREWDQSRSLYRFRCPVCRMMNVKTADDQRIQILSAAGCRTIMSDPPLEWAELLPSGPVFTDDDLIDFHNLLDTQGWFGQLASITKEE